MWRNDFLGHAMAWQCNKNKAGALYWVYLHCAVQNAQGQIEKYISIRTDITASKRLQVQQPVNAQPSPISSEGTNVGNLGMERSEPVR